MLPPAMKNSQNMHVLVIHKVKELIGKPPGENAPEPPVINTLPRRMLLQLGQRVLHRSKKFRSKTGPLLVIPFTGFLNVGLC